MLSIRKLLKAAEATKNLVEEKALPAIKATLQQAYTYASNVTIHPRNIPGNLRKVAYVVTLPWTLLTSTASATQCFKTPHNPDDQPTKSFFLPDIAAPIPAPDYSNELWCSNPSIEQEIFSSIKQCGVYVSDYVGNTNLNCVYFFMGYDGSTYQFPYYHKGYKRDDICNWQYSNQRGGGWGAKNACVNTVIEQITAQYQTLAAQQEQQEQQQEQQEYEQRIEQLKKGIIILGIAAGTVLIGWVIKKTREKYCARSRVCMFSTQEPDDEPNADEAERLLAESRATADASINGPGAVSPV